jgi:serine/threonine-protein kinase
MQGEPGETVLGRYRIECAIGRGGFGRIFLARQLALAREVVLKAVRTEERADPVLQERFRREALVVAGINHPNVVTYHDFGVDADGDLVLVMEYLRGVTLLETRRKGVLPDVTRVACWMVQAAAGLDAAHRTGVIHRDVKPSNLFLVDPDGPAERLKVIDFGILKVDAEPALPALTGSDACVGTPDYLAPEMLVTKQIDGRADQYALALVACELLGGRKPFAGAVPDEVLARLTTRPADLEFRGTGRPASPAVTRILHRALSPQPDERFPSILEFAEALTAAVAKPALADPDETRPITPRAPEPPADPVTRPLSLTPRQRRFRWPLLVAAGMVAAILGVGLALDPPSGNAPPGESEAAALPLASLRQEEREATTTERRKVAVVAMPASRPALPVARPAPAAQAPALLNANAAPWADVMLDGRNLGRAPVVNRSIPPGRHSLVFVHPTLGRVSIPFAAQPGEKITKFTDLEAARAPRTGKTSP